MLLSGYDIYFHFVGEIETGKRSEFTGSFRCRSRFVVLKQIKLSR